MVKMFLTTVCMTVTPAGSTQIRAWCNTNTKNKVLWSKVGRERERRERSLKCDMFYLGSYPHPYHSREEKPALHISNEGVARPIGYLAYKVFDWVTNLFFCMRHLGWQLPYSLFGVFFTGAGNSHIIIFWPFRDPSTKITDSHTANKECL